MDADVVVAGGGIGGFTAALTAQEAGARVLLIEKADRVGGSAAASGGTLWCAQDIESWTAVQPGGDVSLGRALVDSFFEGIPWITSQGVTLRLLQEPRPYKFPRVVYTMEPTAAVALATLAERFVARGGTIQTSTTLQEVLLTDSGAVRGVRAVASGTSEPTGDLTTSNGQTPPARPASSAPPTPGRIRDLSARAVVLATGGFQGNPELRARYMGQWSDRMVVRANPHSAGDGLRAAVRAGVATAGPFDRFYGHMLPAPPAEVGLHNYAQVKPDFSEAAIFVNLHGERFDDEALGDEITVHAAIHQPEATVFLLYDDVIRAAATDAAAQRTAAGRPGADRIQNIKDAGGVILEAPSIERLASQMATHWFLDGARLVDTVSTYNAAARSGRGSSLAPPKSSECTPLETPPFYGLQLVVGITFTYGGIRINDQAQALSVVGAPVPGLYVAGADVGGVYTRGYTGGLALGLAFGRIAGRHAAAEAS